MTTGKDVLQHWMLAWRLLAALTFVVVAAAGAGMPAGWPGAQPFWILLAAMVLWYGASILIGRERLHDSLPVSLLYFAPGWVIWARLLELHTASFAFAAFMFPLTYSQLPTRRAIVFAIIAMGLMFARGSAWEVKLNPAAVLGGALGVVSSIMLALFIDSIIRQSEERKQLIEELKQARSELAQAERQAGVLTERQRLAQQIHDTVAQGFVGIVTHLEAAETSLDEAAPARAHVTAAKASARESLGEARRLVWDLRPDLLEGESLPAVLERHVAGWSAQTRVAAAQVVTGTPRPLGAEREAAVVQAAREALNNVRAHAGARRVTLTLSYMDDEIVLDVQDDGVGIQRPAAPSEGRGFGLRALEERVRSLGGHCALESNEGEGATLTVTLPFAPTAS